jgi:hypothetical protein
MRPDSHVHTIGGVVLWIEQETSIQIKALSEYGDPLELTGQEARELAALLMQLAEEIDE